MYWIEPLVGFALGGLIGSFLNVVVWRGPEMWGLLEEGAPARGNLLSPRSYCPSCRASIPAVRNIPLASYFILRGRCADCGAAIPVRYILVEMLGAGAGLAVVLIYGAGVTAALAAVFLFALIALAVIDWETGFLPDAMTLPLIATGLAANIGGRFVSLTDALIGAAAGYMVLWTIAALYSHLRGREGLGLGDAKLLAALGAWQGWAVLPVIVFIAALTALGAVSAAKLRKPDIGAQTPVAFGPALALAAGVVFLLREHAWFIG